MATRASSKKDSSPKSATKADQPNKTAPPNPTTDLISPVKKRAATETRHTSRSGVPPITKAKKQPVPPPSPAVVPAAEPAPVAPPPKPETISLIDDNKSKRSEESS